MLKLTEGIMEDESLVLKSVVFRVGEVIVYDGLSKFFVERIKVLFDDFVTLQFIEVLKVLIYKFGNLFVKIKSKLFPVRIFFLRQYLFILLAFKQSLISQ